MKNLLIVLLLTINIGCGEDDSKDKIINNPLITYKCGTLVNCIDLIEVGDNVKTELFKGLFDTLKYTTYNSGSYCSKNYTIFDYNAETWDWNYYYSISTDCNGNVVSVYIN